MLMENSVTRSSINAISTLVLHSAECLGFGPVKHISVFNFKHKNNQHIYCTCIVCSSLWSPAVSFPPVETHSVGHHKSWSSDYLHQRNLLESQMLCYCLHIGISLQRNQGPTPHPILTCSQKYVD